MVGSRPIVQEQPTLTDTQAFFAGGNRFYIRGVDYQPGTLSSPSQQSQH